MTVHVTIPSIAEFLTDTVRRRIDYRVARLSRKFHLRAADRHDLRQDFRLTILKARLNYDLRACPLGRFVLMVVNRRYKHHVRQLCAKLRPSGHVRNAMSLEDVSDEVKELIPDPSLEALLRQVELQHDFAAAFGHVGLVERRICLLLMAGHSPSEVAREMNMAPSSVPRAIERVRKQFEKVGFGRNFWNS